MAAVYGPPDCAALNKKLYTLILTKYLLEILAQICGMVSYFITVGFD
jgi:hypothetical protein